MKTVVQHILRVELLVLFATLTLLFQSAAGAQNGELRERVTEMKEAAAKNKQALTQYTYAEQVTISVKGEQKKVEHFQVRTGADGKPQKTSLDPPADASAPKGGRLKQHVVEKKKEEYKDYAEQMKALSQQYVPPDKDQLQRAYEAGNITLGTVAGDPNDLQLVVRNYVKPDDSMTLVFDKTRKELVRVRIASYMDDPKDAMNLTVQFASLPDGTKHVSSMVIDGVRKQLNIATQNSDYQHL
ncbi:MAG: hypothetical protein WAL52_10510 [Candidatus Sulfotelmatobacter sp.]